MRSLFFKIFLWFWVAQILIGASLYALAMATQRGPDERLRAAAGDNLEVWARAAAIAYESGGPEALRAAWRLSSATIGTNGLDERALAAFYIARGDLYTGRAPDSHEPLAGPAVPSTVATIIGRAFRSGEDVMAIEGGASWLARRIETPSGGLYVAAVKLRPPRNSDPLRFWRTSSLDGLLRLLVVALTMGAVCYTLARYLASPARTLRDATQRFADGDLSARVGKAMGRRRDELADLGRDFDVMAERIQALMMSERHLAEGERRRVEAQRRLLADISHELRSPLARIAYALDLAGTSGGDTSKYLSRIGRESGRLNELIGQLLTLARLEGDGDIGTGTSLDLARLIVEIAEDADFEAQSRDCRVQAAPLDACRMEGAPDLLRSAIENVVRNAVRYTPEGTTVEVSLSCTKAARSANDTSPGAQPCGEAIVRVRDYGPGVPEASLSELFRPFYRVEDARDRQSGGTGLGLSIAERAVRLHGGSVQAFNAPDGGLIIEMKFKI